jgi:AcrR family transcriptional regulator
MEDAYDRSMATVRSAPVDRATLVSVAADLADRDGWHALTLSEVAKAVGRHPSSMYGHVVSLEDLRREIALASMAELAEKVWRATLGKIGAEALTAIAEQYRDFAKEHPGRTASLSTLSEDDPDFAVQAARLHEPLQATFRSFGLDDDQATVAHRVFGATVDGFVRTGGLDIRQVVAVFVTALSTGSWPLHD